MDWQLPLQKDRHYILADDYIHSMVMKGEPPDTDSSRTELFEALGHPARMKILQSLNDAPMGFSELKRKVGMESSGHLQFHLGKLDGLVKTTPEGNYVLTDDGKEALRLLETVGNVKGMMSNEMSDADYMKGMIRRLQLSIAFVAIFIVLVLISSAFSPFDLYQKIVLVISAAIIAGATFFILWTQWVKTATSRI